MDTVATRPLDHGDTVDCQEGNSGGKWTQPGLDWTVRVQLV